jgi:hypothetical protein
MSADRTALLRRAALAAAGCAALLAAGQAAAQSTFVIINNNAPGIGFNDATPATPVGGNNGTTLGEQRLIAAAHAANIWGANLTSTVPIRIGAQFTALTCTETSAVLGSAGATSSQRNFANAPFADTWYPVALRNKYVGAEATPGSAQITMNFNANLGTPGCLPASPWYLGLDNNAPPGHINLVVVLLHEFAHGLGFAVSPTSGSTGARSSLSPSIWERFMFDNVTGLTWFQMTSNAQRAASSIAVDKLAWAGTNVVSAAPSVLRQGIATLGIAGKPVSNPRDVTAGEASFGAPFSAKPFTGEVMPVVDQSNGTGLACTPLSAANARAVLGKVALVDRGTCNFVIKANNVKAAGAIGMIVVDNVAATLPPNIGGSDPGISFPMASLRQVDGQALRADLQRRSRTSSGVFATFKLTGTQLAGADLAGRVKLFTPNPFQGGSSVSHWDTTAFRHQLMEPAINGDLTQTVVPPIDLTVPLFQDIGW